MQKNFRFLHITEISAILAYYCPDLVSLGFVENLGNLFEFTNPLNLPTPLYLPKIPRFLAQNWNFYHFLCLFTSAVVYRLVFNRRKNLIKKGEYQFNLRLVPR